MCHLAGQWMDCVTGEFGVNTVGGSGRSHKHSAQPSATGFCWGHRSNVSPVKVVIGLAAHIHDTVRYCHCNFTEKAQREQFTIFGANLSVRWHEHVAAAHSAKHNGFVRLSSFGTKERAKMRIIVTHLGQDNS